MHDKTRAILYGAYCIFTCAIQALSLRVYDNILFDI